MKRADLEKKLRKAGWKFQRYGGKHDVWACGTETVPVPRHKEINEYTAKKILEKVSR